MAKENELLSLGGQAAAAAHSLGTLYLQFFLLQKNYRKILRKMKNLKKILIYLFRKVIDVEKY